ncbi:MAG TPA: hypothetical protein DF613_07560 [Lachnospiraceae bacterium]|nr:hypothetical protein [Lachnospiraceae bacterium]
MSEDMFAFDESKRSAFMNRVFKNFRSQAKASVELYCQKQEEEIRGRLEEIDCDDEIREKIVGGYVTHECQTLRERIDWQTRNKAVGEIYRINNENLEYLRSAECRGDEFYGHRVGLYLKCVMEEYCALPYMEREKIFFKESYDKVKSAIRSHAVLKICMADGRRFYIYPYKLIEDMLSTRCYLVGYSKEAASAAKEKKMVSLRVPRLKSIQLLERRCRLTEREILDLEKTIAVRTVQFLVGEEEEIRVYLTDEGIRQYERQMYLRPIKDLDASTEHEYVFHCTPVQAEYYFFKFGAEARILKPENLKKRFARKYEAAVIAYRET